MFHCFSCENCWSILIQKKKTTDSVIYARKLKQNDGGKNSSRIMNIKIKENDDGHLTTKNVWFYSDLMKKLQWKELLLF